MRVQTYVVEIPQNIGGKLVCNASYSCDQFGCDSLVEYNLVNGKGESTRIGYGNFEEEAWDKNIQIQKVLDRLILNTETWESSIAVLFVGDTNGAKWTEYQFSPAEITKSQAWHASGIQSLETARPYSSTITEIKEDGEIDLIYEFRKTSGDMATDKKLLVYKLDSGGMPQLTEIKSI